MKPRAMSMVILLLLAASPGDFSRATPAAKDPSMALHGGASSAEELISRFLQALRDNDREALRQLRLTESEYREIVLPGHVAVDKPLRRHPEDVSRFAWQLLNTKSNYFEAALLGEFGGHAYEVKGVEYEQGTQSYATYIAYKQLRLTLQRDDGLEMELRTGSVADIQGSFKFVSYIRD
jgi:hypothetical protein